MKNILLLCGSLALLAGCTSVPQPLTLTEATATPTPAGRIVGFVFVDANANEFLDDGETLLSGVAVTAQTTEQTFTQATVNGWFGFGGLPNGTWLLTAMAADYVCAGRSVLVDGGKITSHLPCTMQVPTPTPTETPTAAPSSTPTATPTRAPGSLWQVEPLPGDCFRLRHVAFASIYKICIAAWPQVSVYAETVGD